MSWPDYAKGLFQRYLPIVLVVLCVLAYLRYAPEGMRPWSQKPGPVVEAPQPKEVIKWKVQTVTVAGPEKIVYLDKGQLAGALKMPELRLSPDNVTAVATIPRHVGSTTAVATLSPEGVGKILYRQEPAKFFELKKEFSAEARYLFLGRNIMEAELKIQPLRVGPVELIGAVGVEVRRDDQSFGPRAWVGAEYKF